MISCWKMVKKIRRRWLWGRQVDTEAAILWSIRMIARRNTQCKLPPLHLANTPTQLVRSAIWASLAHLSWTRWSSSSAPSASNAFKWRDSSPSWWKCRKKSRDNLKIKEPPRLKTTTLSRQLTLSRTIVSCVKAALEPSIRDRKSPSRRWACDPKALWIGDEDDKKH